ncbi:MAG: hypothetical protein K0Q73_8908 [Paenibacillus sp.]|nr:hypothetical protein [Paenibacillus sp.]
MRRNFMINRAQKLGVALEGLSTFAMRRSYLVYTASSETFASKENL